MDLSDVYRLTYEVWYSLFFLFHLGC